MVKRIKKYICPYCGIEYNDNFWSYDHIIPSAIGGADKFKVISCSRCNYLISKEFEQKAIQSPIIDFEIKNLLREGHDIKIRRKKYHITLVKTLHDTSLGIPVKLGYDLIRKANTMKFVGRKSKNLNINAINEFWIKLKGDTISHDDKLAFSSLQYKILVGTCAWVFGIDDHMNHFLSKLRELMWNRDPNKIFKCWCSNKYSLSLVSSWKDDQLYKIITFNLENPPHHTILIRKTNNHLHSTVNLFGSLEVAICLGQIPLSNQIKVDENFEIFLIVKTDSNKVLKMEKDDYLKYKRENKSYKEEIKSLQDLQSEGI